MGAVLYDVLASLSRPAPQRPDMSAAHFAQRCFETPSANEIYFDPRLNFRHLAKSLNYCAK
jgi:hypothetical protein